MRMLAVVIVLVVSSVCAAGAKLDDMRVALHVVWMVEGSGQLHPRPGDGGKAIGPLQIWKIRVDDANRICRLKKLSIRFTYADRNDIRKSMQMFVVSCLHYHPNGSVQDWLRHWNGNPVTGPWDENTLAYWGRCRKYLLP